MGEHPATGHQAAIRSAATMIVSRSIEAWLQALADRPDGDAALTVPRAKHSTAPAELARRQPGTEQARARLRTAYEHCLAHFRAAQCREERPRGTDDMGAAAAHFVAVNLELLHGAAADAAALTPLARQLARMLRANPAWARAGVRERQRWFEQLALLSVFVRESAAQGVRQGLLTEEQVRGAARAYLLELLGVEPLSLQLTPGGLALRRAD